MHFLFALTIITMVVLGLNFCFLLVGGPPWHKGDEHEPVKMGRRTYSIERFAVGVSVSTLGLAWLAAWFYFLLTGWHSFMSNFSNLIIHVALQLAAAIGLIVAGISIFRQWRRSKGLFWIGMGLLLGSILVALLRYGAAGHGSTPMFMWLFAAWTYAVGIILTVAVYLIGRLLHNYDERLPEEERSSE